MIKSTLNLISSLFSDNPNEEQVEELFNEVLLVTLARATKADSNIHPVEVELVKEKLEAVTGHLVSVKDVRVAANSELFERTTLDNLLGRVSSLVTIDKKIVLMKALSDILKADQRVTEREIRFFNRVSRSLSVTPADIIGLTPM
ncbi:MAG: TerB family tellurite resistance protein [Gammaproteobacteria bacterium]|nr:TerB family tellurite resistance protein [Gammaproteobacteria bacterium]